MQVRPYFFGARLIKTRATLAKQYQHHITGREAHISFVTEAELRFGARWAGWGEARLYRLEAVLASADVVLPGPGLIEAYVNLRHQCMSTGPPQQILGQFAVGRAGPIRSPARPSIVVYACPSRIARADSPIWTVMSLADSTVLTRGALSAPARRHISSRSPSTSRVGIARLNFGIE